MCLPTSCSLWTMFPQRPCSVLNLDFAAEFQNSVSMWILISQQVYSLLWVVAFPCWRVFLSYYHLLVCFFFLFTYTFGITLSKSLPKSTCHRTLSWATLWEHYSFWLYLWVHLLPIFTLFWYMVFSKALISVFLHASSFSRTIVKNSMSPPTRNGPDTVSKMVFYIM